MKMALNEDIQFLTDLLKVRVEKSKGIVELVKALHNSGIPLQKMSFAKSRMAPVYEVLRRVAEKKHLSWEEYDDILLARGWNPENARRHLEAIAREGKFIQLGDNGIHWVEQQGWFRRKKGE